MLAVAGVAIISFDPRGHRPSRDLAPSVCFGLLTALGFGGFLVAMDAASEGGVPWALLMARLTAVVVFTGVFFARQATLAVPRPRSRCSR